MIHKRVDELKPTGENEENAAKQVLEDEALSALSSFLLTQHLLLDVTVSKIFPILSRIMKP